nr:unnamed protein product [Callosobruchus analis]
MDTRRKETSKTVLQGTYQMF